MKRAISILAILFSFCSFSQEREVSNEDEPFVKVDESAGFPGGIDGFYRFLSQNLRYPKHAQRAGIEGRVFVQFIVEKNGKITNVEIVEGIGGGCDEEVLRIMKLMPDWTPAKLRGKLVRQRLIQNILFKFSTPSGQKSILDKPSIGDFEESQVSVFNLGRLIIGLDEYSFFGPNWRYFHKSARHELELKNFVEKYVFSLVSNPKYLPTSISTQIQFTVFEDGSLGDFILGDKINVNDTLFVETLLSLGKWKPAENDNKSTFKLELKSRDKIHDEDAHFLGGIPEFNRYLESSLRLPFSSQRLFADSQVIVEFFIEVDGSVSNAKVIKSVGPAYDQEALRVIKEMPKWIPKSENGIPVRQRIEQPVIFRIDLEHRYIKFR